MYEKVGLEAVTDSASHPVLCAACVFLSREQGAKKKRLAAAESTTGGRTFPLPSGIYKPPLYPLTAFLRIVSPGLSPGLSQLVLVAYQYIRTHTCVAGERRHLSIQAHTHTHTHRMPAEGESV